MGNQNIYFTDSANDGLSEGLEILLREHGYEQAAEKDGAALQLTGHFWEKESLKIVKLKETCDIYYNKKSHFFRGVSLLLQNSKIQDFILEETPNFDSNGMMMDCSRNGVPTVDTIKKYIVRLAAFGMNRLYLYMEDTLEIEEYPYWGYLRGRFSKREIQECDSYAAQFGVTLVPCIQTLAHLRSALKLPAFRGYKDIDDILLLEDAKSQKLLDSLLKTVSECFSGGIVHLGMDEAAHLGRGRYLDQHGYKEPDKIMKSHLKWLTNVCKTYGLSPVIWSDMYLKLNFDVEDYYSLTGDEIPVNEDNLSHDIALCYWDYYNEGTAFYEKYIRLHQKLGNPIVFAGGAWTWNGVSPGISKALSTTDDALKACCETGIKDVFFTAWMDNGAETPLVTTLPTFALYGEYGFSRRPDPQQLKERFCSVFGKRWDDYCLLDAFDYQAAGTSEHNRYCENPSKTILYEDSLMGLMSTVYDEDKFQKQYERLSEKIDLILKKRADLDQEDLELFEYYRTLAKLLSLKAGITGRIRRAYDVKDMQKLVSIVENELTPISSLAEKLRIQRQTLWMKEYKPFGYELLDIRLAGVAARAKSAADRLLSFVSGKQTCLQELEEEILPYKTPEMLEHEILHGYYKWDIIISAGNIEGI